MFYVQSHLFWSNQTFKMQKVQALPSPIWSAILSLSFTFLFPLYLLLLLLSISLQNDTSFFFPPFSSFFRLPIGLHNEIFVDFCISQTSIRISRAFKWCFQKSILWSSPKFTQMTQEFKLLISNHRDLLEDYYLAKCSWVTLDFSLPLLESF